MDKKIVTIIGIALLLFVMPASLWAWCWIRDTGLSDDDCTTGSYQQNCCDGTLRKWLDGNMTYYISTSTDDLLEGYIVAGVERWNNVDTSDFTFDRGTPDTTEFEFNEDGINLINIDSQFCDESHYSDLCGQGILGFSGTFTPAPGSGEPFQAKESDIVLNGAEYVWADGDPIGSTPTIDTEGVIAHEAGHSAGLSHAGSECRSSGSSGCGPEFPAATMYWNYDGGQPTDKASLELDDIAALVYGYPKSTFQIEVLNDPNGLPIIGAKVRLINSAAPVNGTSIETGGNVRGDISFVTSQLEFGDGDSSLTYSTESPFDDTDSDGLTNAIHPVIANLSVEATAGSLSSGIQAHTVADGNSTFTVYITTGETDFAGPTVAVTSHTSGQAVGTATITLAGTATDSGRGDSGVSQVTINGAVADNGTASLGGVANWSRDITLDEGSNTLTIVAYDNQSSEPNTSSLTFFITYDTTPPTVLSVSPANGATGVATIANFGVAFSEAMNPSTINTSTFVVDNGATGTVIYSAGNHSAIFVPSAPLAFDTTYTARLTTGIQDAVGLPMTADYTWSISTGAPAGGSGDDSSCSGCFVGTVASRQAQ